VALLVLGETGAVETLLRFRGTSEADAAALKTLGTLDSEDTLAERLSHHRVGGRIPSSHERKTLAGTVDLLLQQLRRTKY
jgi:hypothetical protein